MKNPQSDLLELALRLPKHDTELQQKTVNLLGEVFPVLDSWSRQQSKNYVGLEVPVKHLAAGLVRNLWRSVQIGENFRHDLRPTKADESRFDWSRAGTKLLESIYRNIDEFDVVSIPTEEVHAPSRKRPQSPLQRKFEYHSQ